MSVQQFVFLRDSELPSPQRWQAEIDAAGFDLKLDLDFDPREFTGFLPATLHGKQTGFEYYFAPAADVQLDDPPSDLGGRDRVVAFVTHSDMTELAAAACAAGALAHLVGGLLFDSAAFIDSAGAIQYARDTLAEVQRIRR